jgi:hypothetical protein
MRRVLPALLLLPVLAFLASGCGSGSALSLDPVASAATKTQHAGTFHFDFKASIGLFGQQLQFSGSGVSDTANGAAQLTMDFSGLPAALTKNGSTVEAIIVDKTMYVKLPFLNAHVPTGKAWMKVDLAQAARASGGSLSSFDDADPQQWLRQLLVSSDTQKLGTDTVQGEQMTHYSLRIDLSKLAQVPADKRAAVQGAPAQLDMKKIPVDVWVDSQGLVRRESISSTLGKAASGNSSLTLTMNMSDFGTTSSITAPPADQVFDATKLALQRAASK